MPPKVTAVTTTPAIRTPAVIAISACLKPIPKTKAAAHPDHAPVAGSGMATKIANPRVPYFSKVSEWLWRVRVKSQSKNLFQNLNLRK